MCGIAGVAGAGIGFEAEAVLGALAHRGPDASGTDQVTLGDWSCAVAHTRLAINDLSAAANQPLGNEDGSLALVFNGEIYNSPELRRHCEARGHRFGSRSDGEVILHLWEDEGEASLCRLNGIFAFALLDRRAGELILVRDPLGVKPLFWSTKGTSLWFASELAAIRAAGAPADRHDPIGLAQFLTFLWIPDPRTPFADIRSLLPGEMLRWRQGEYRRRIYCDLVSESADCPRVTAKEAQAEIGDRLRAAVERQLLADVPVAIMASGGIDSSLLWLAAEHAIERAYTIDWSGHRTSEGLDEDTSAVRRLERFFETKVTYVPGDEVDVQALPPSGDLFADPAVDLCRLISRRARNDGFKVLLSGQGGDELFGGYRRHLLGPLAARLPLGSAGARLAGQLAAHGTGTVGIEYVARLLLSASRNDALSSYLVLCSYSTAADRAEALGCMEAEVDDEVVWQRHREVFEQMPKNWSLLRRFRGVDLAVYMPGLGVAYGDRAGMQYGVEIRVPWLDLDLVRWALNLADGALVRGRVGKRLTRSLAQTVLLEQTVNRPKRGFGAPISLVGTGSRGSRGFRQGEYFSAARSLLATWLGDPVAVAN